MTNEVLEIEEGMISNTPRFGKRPRNLRWTYWLFATRVTTDALGRQRRQRREVIELNGDTEDEVDRKVVELVERPNVVLVEPK